MKEKVGREDAAVERVRLLSSTMPVSRGRPGVSTTSILQIEFKIGIKA